MNPHHYRCRQAVSAFFLAPAAGLRSLLPPGLVPLEVRPMHGVLAITAFDFHASAVGPYSEVALSVLVPPFASRGADLPHAATFPFSLNTSTPASAEDAHQRWHLPFSESPVRARFSHDAETYRVEVSQGGVPVLELEVGRGTPEPGTRLYQLFTRRDEQLCRVPLRIDGPFEQRDDEVGQLTLHEHPLAQRIAALIADDVPILEQCMSGGEQHFGEVTAHLRAGAA